ncbi:CshA/CshB family fibrillar adhesin-related protein [Bifidobacterium sp. ESL0728]|uniref:CshA/CshB family fibrillar adhesin-related protein n=1 Tax=Bifidobacterium sp. ESL0728 TaxID=2983220 RepID=UPI0023F9AF33|nr:CshA/CshB family fibrillar adhesin-related protein [Bifidobacterium sp. ESL0728]WEV59029.1 CshA/CshB family fibrillar adhesin-related protein [Bifidobacterium sp. ESL0728]
MAFANHANALPATGGNGRMGTAINWVEWGAKDAVISGSKVTWTKPVQAGPSKWMSTRCSLVPTAGATDALSSSKTVTVYTPGSYGGDGLGQMYFDGGPGYANTMKIGLATTNDAEKVTFDFSCSAYLIDSSTDPSGNLNDSTNTSGSGFLNVPLQGLVFADAESNNWTYYQKEYIKATPQNGANPAWRLLDSYRTPGCTTNSVAELKGSTMRFRSDGGQCSNSGGTGPSSTMFLQGSTSATVTLKGGGKTAVALGSIVSSDFGDAPESFGVAGSMFQPSWQGGELGNGDIPSTDYATQDSNDPDNSMVGGKLFNLSAAKDGVGSNPNLLANTAAPSPRLGAHEDGEASPHFDADADWDDLNGDSAFASAPGDVVNDEDGVDIPSSTHAINVMPGADGTFSQKVRCYGTGDVRGWIDWNHDGQFEAAQATSNAQREAEASNQVACTADSSSSTGYSATLTWILPGDAKRQISGDGTPSYMRLRITNQTDPGTGNIINMQPTGMTSGSGEVEDYKADVHVPTLSVLTNIVGDRKHPSDQFNMTVHVTSTGAQINNVTTTGSDNGVQHVQVGPRSVGPGYQYTLASDLASGSTSVAADYTTSVKCADFANHNADVPIGSDGKMTMPVNYDSDVRCIFLKTSSPDPALTMTTLVHNNHGGTKQAGDFTFTATSDDGNPAHVYNYESASGSDSHTVAPGNYTIEGSPVPAGYKDNGITYTDENGNTLTLAAAKLALAQGHKAFGVRVLEDVPGKLTLKTEVDNANGGTATPNDFHFGVTPDGGNETDTVIYNEGDQKEVSATKYTVAGSALPGYDQVGDITYTDDVTHLQLTPVAAQIAIANGQSVTGVRKVASKPANLTIKTVVRGGSAVPSDFPVTATPTGGSAVSMPDSVSHDFPGNHYEVATDLSARPGYTISSPLNCVLNNSVQLPLVSGKVPLDYGQNVVCTQEVTPGRAHLTLSTVVQGDGTATPNDFDFTVTPAGGSGQNYKEGVSQDAPAGNFTVVGSDKPDYEQVGDIVYHKDSDPSVTLTLAQAQAAIADGESVSGVRTVKSHQPVLTVKLVRNYRYGGTAAGDGSQISLVPQTGSAQDVTLDTARHVASGTYSIKQLLNAGYKQTDIQVKLDDGTPVTVAADGTFVVPQDKNVIVTVTNEDEPGTVEWSRFDQDGKTLLPGSTWHLSGPNNASIDVTDCTAGPCTGIDQDPTPGKFKVPNLPWGEWTITEVTPPAGHELTKPVTLPLNPTDGLLQHAQFQNGKKPVVTPGAQQPPAQAARPLQPQPQPQPRPRPQQHSAPVLSATGSAVAMIATFAAGLLMLAFGIVTVGASRKGRHARHA